MRAHQLYRLQRLQWANETVEITRVAFGTDGFVPHFHDGLAIGLVRSGANIFHSGRRLVEVEAGSLSIVNAGEVHDGGLAGRPWSYDNLLVPWTYLAAIAAELNLAPELDRHRIDAPESLAKARTFFKLVHDEDVEGEAVEQAGLSLLSTLLQDHATAPRAAEPPEVSLALRVNEALRDHADWRLSLADLEHMLGASRFQMIRAVQARYGLTPHQLQLQIRVERARGLILGGAQIADAAIACGFADQAHLTRELKRRWGAPPGRMRRHAG